MEDNILQQKQKKGKIYSNLTLNGVGKKPSNTTFTQVRITSGERGVGGATQRTQWFNRGYEGLYCRLLHLLIQCGLQEQPQWGCNLGAMGTDAGAEETEGCPSAGGWAAD